ncbi:MAG: TonB-dependent receptor [Pseudomonadota bacterium]
MSKLKAWLTGGASAAVALWGGGAAAQVEEVVVTGIRGSLERAVDVKENAGSIVDAISAEDIADFPDTNVAESLARITGVAITRTRGGEGQFVTVRGLGEEFNAVTYNGRLLATENNGREFSFDVIASELISGAEVYKSSEARLGDGSLGGRVNIRSAKPLSRPGFHATGSFSGQYEGLDESTGLRATGVVSNTWADDTFGMIASISYQQRDARTDIAESTFLIPDVLVDANGLVNGGLDADGDGFSDDTGAVITNRDARFNGFAPSVAFTDRRRIGGTVAFQWTPSDQTEVVVDALYTNFESPGQLFGYSYFPSAFDGSFTGTNAAVNEFNQVVAHEIQAFALDLVSRQTEGEAETIAFGANIEHYFNDRWSINLDAAYSNAEGNRDNFGSASGSGTFFVLGYPNNAQFTFDANGRLTPDATFTALNLPTDTGNTSIENLTADDIRLHFARRDTIEVEDEIISLRADSKLEFGDADVLRFGVDFVGREKSNTAFNNLANQCRLCGYATPVAQNSPQLVPSLLQTFDDSFLSTADGNFPRVFPFFTTGDLEQAYADSGNADALIATFDPSASSVVEENVWGTYFQFDLDGELGRIPFMANFGTRFAYTSLTSTGSAGSLGSIVSSTLVRDPNGMTTSNQEFGFAAGGDVEIDNDYFDVLPSFNINFDLTDNYKLRLAASRSLSRPTLTDLSTFFSVTSFNPGGEQVQSANPELEAIRANNFDLSIERYGDGGTYFAVAAFYKDISDFVTNRVVEQTITVPQVIRENDGSITDNGIQDINFLVFAPQNGDSAEVYGLELAAQYLSNAGFGVSGNVTFADSTATTDGVSSQLENISDVSANGAVFYENYGFQARLSVNYRSDYLIGQTVEGGLNEFADDFTQFDLSMSYQLNDTLTVFLEGINIFNEEVIRISEFANSGFLESFEENGARWVLGVRGGF